MTKTDNTIREAPQLARNTQLASVMGFVCGAVLFHLDWDLFFVQAYFFGALPFALFAAPTLKWLDVRQKVAFALILSVSWPLSIFCAGWMQFAMIFPLTMGGFLLVISLLLFKKAQPLLSLAFALGMMAIPFVVLIAVVGFYKIGDSVSSVIVGLGFPLLNLLFYSFIKMNLTKNEEDNHRRR